MSSSRKIVDGPTSLNADEICDIILDLLESLKDPISDTFVENARIHCPIGKDIPQDKISFRVPSSFEPSDQGAKEYGWRVKNNEVVWILQ
jgi:hypothetical protein